MSNITGFPDSHFTFGMRVTLICLSAWVGKQPQLAASGGQSLLAGRLSTLGRSFMTVPPCKQSCHDPCCRKSVRKNLEALSRQRPPLYTDKETEARRGR